MHVSSSFSIRSRALCNPTDKNSETDNLLRVKAGNTANGPGIFTIHMKTDFDTTGIWATRVEWYSQTGYMPPKEYPDKRSVGGGGGVGETQLIRYEAYDDGTAALFRRSVPDDHGHPHLRKRDLDVDPFDEPGIEVEKTIMRSAKIDEDTDAPDLVARQASGASVCPIGSSESEDPEDEIDDLVLQYKATAPGKRVQSGKKLRILTIGDSITVGFKSDEKGGDGNGYRLKLRNDLSGKFSLSITFLSLY